MSRELSVSSEKQEANGPRAWFPSALLPPRFSLQEPGLRGKWLLSGRGWECTPSPRHASVCQGQWDLLQGHASCTGAATSGTVLESP